MKFRTNTQSQPPSFPSLGSYRGVGIPRIIYNPSADGSCRCGKQSRLLLLGLEVVEDDGTLRRLLAPVLNYDTRAVDDLARVTLPVQDT